MTAADAIAAATDRLRRLCQRDVQGSWRGWAGELPGGAEGIGPAMNLDGGAIALPNDQGYLTWPAGRQVQWYAQRWVLPETWAGYPLRGLTLRLALTWWAEDAQIFANGQLVQAGDLFDSSARVVLTERIAPGQVLTVALRLVSPGHDIGGLMRSRLLAEAPSYNLTEALDPGFVADEIDVLAKYAAAFAPERLGAIATALEALDESPVSDAALFDAALRRLRQTLAPLAADLKQRRITLLGHAHLDMAWLWELPETYDAAERTFRSVLKLRREFPDLTFCHTSPALYEWFAAARPELFDEICGAIAAGTWEPLGGMWIEPDANLPNGESLARQLLYGQRYTRDQWGSTTRIAWLTDTFGFSWQLPQFLALAGIEYFVTQKLHWNDSTEFPHGVFWWQAPDGTKILALMSPPNVTGVMDTNPQTTTNYSVNWEQQTGLRESFWLPGVGDRGGGPTRDMLAVQVRWQQSPFFPRLEFGTAEQFLDRLVNPSSDNPEIPASSSPPGSRGMKDSPALGDLTPTPLLEGEGLSGPLLPERKQGPGDEGFPTWNDELYLELHRGCYTAHADQKWFNRRAEGLLYEAELLASLVVLSAARGVGALEQFVYPQQELEQAWKRVLFNQFHDILPGTSIPGVFVTANQEWRAAIATAESIIARALAALLAAIASSPAPVENAQPWIVFNTLNWARSEAVELAVPAGDWQVFDRQGQPLPSQRTAAGTLLVAARDIPALGYATIWLQALASDGEQEAIFPPGRAAIAPATEQTWQLENDSLRAVIDSESGDLASLFDKRLGRELLSGPGNMLQCFRDQGQYWDAWNIDPAYEQHPLPAAQLTRIEWLERGPVRSRLRVVRQFQQSTFQHDYSLGADSPVLAIATAVDWQEQHVVAKVAFPLQLEADWATYEIPSGAIARTTKPATPAERAQWEVCGQRWADLTDNSGEYGVSLLNDCKYGFDHQPGRLRLTLLRAPQWPHPDCDRGRHRCTYALYPHAGSWSAAQTPRAAAALNLPLRACPQSSPATHPSLPPRASLLAVNSDTAMLMALKRSEDEAATFIVRLYESAGQAGRLTLGGWLAPQVLGAVDLLERSRNEASDRAASPQEICLRPWQILSLALRCSAG